MKIIDSMWFHTTGVSFVFVLGEDDMGKRTLSYGIAYGLNYKAEEYEVLSWGNKVNINMLKDLIAKTKAK